MNLNENSAGVACPDIFSFKEKKPGLKQVRIKFPRGELMMDRDLLLGLSNAEGISAAGS